MSRAWTIWVVLGSLMLSIALGAVVGFSVRYLQTMYVSDDVRHRMVVLYVVASLLVFLVAGIWRGLRFVARHVFPVTAALAIAMGLIAVISGTGTGAGALLGLVFIALAAVLVALSVLARATAGTTGKLVFAIVAVAGGLAGGATGGGLTAAVIAICAMVMARRSERIEPAYPFMAKATAAIASRGGTRFRDANLAGANLDHASLVACDFRGANLTGAHCEHASIRLSRFDRTVSGSWCQPRGT